MKYCSTCGSEDIQLKIPEDDHAVRKVCGSCGAVFYDNPKVVVGCIPIWKGKVLLAKRGIEPEIGKWNLPAGFLEIGETLEEGAVREMVEETHGKVEITHLQTLFDLPHAGLIYAFFEANLLSPEVEITPESTAYGFFDEQDMPWDDLAFSSNANVLKRYFGGSGKKIHYEKELKRGR